MNLLVFSAARSKSNDSQTQITRLTYMLKFPRNPASDFKNTIDKTKLMV